MNHNMTKLILPITRLIPSTIFASKGYYTFRKLKSITHINTSLPLSLHYHQIQNRLDKKTDCPNYHSVLDITHLNYPFYYLPYYPYNPELYKNKFDFAKSTEIRLIFDEFTQMLNQYKIKESYDYYKLSENLYINFSNTLEYPYSKNGSLQTSQKIVDTTVNKSGC